MDHFVLLNLFTTNIFGEWFVNASIVWGFESFCGKPLIHYLGNYCYRIICQSPSLIDYILIYYLLMYYKYTSGKAPRIESFSFIFIHGTRVRFDHGTYGLWTHKASIVRLLNLTFFKTPKCLQQCHWLCLNDIIQWHWGVFSGRQKLHLSILWYANQSCVCRNLWSMSELLTLVLTKLFLDKMIYMICWFIVWKILLKIIPFMISKWILSYDAICPYILLKIL